MTHDPTSEDSAMGASPPASPPLRRHRWRRWIILIVLIVVLAPVLVGVIWTVAALNYSYAHGERAGYVQKFSRKGWLCKTWEGELAMVNVPGAMQERWAFSVRNDSIAQRITNSMGERVALSYDQHKGLPSACFGETEYFITGVQVLGAVTPVVPAARPPATAARPTSTTGPGANY